MWTKLKFTVLLFCQSCKYVKYKWMKVTEVTATSINITVYIKWRILGKHRDLRNTHRPSHMTERVILTLCWDWNAFLSHGFIELCLVLLFCFILFFFCLLVNMSLCMEIWPKCVTGDYYRVLHHNHMSYSRVWDDTWDV